MPESRIRRKSAYTPPPRRSAAKIGSPRWLVPLMLAFFVLGLLWIVVYYVSRSQWPVEALGNYNLLVGFGLIAVGFGLSTQWK